MSASTNKYYVACDLGAESGRVILGTLCNGKLQLEEVVRFPTGPIDIEGTLRWDLWVIFKELKRGLAALATRGLPIASFSIDSWGVDYVLFNAEELMLGTPYHYRDPRTKRTYDTAIADVGRAQIFSETGIQFMPLNTLYQLMAEMEQHPELVTRAEHFLNIADYFHYLLCGKVCAEATLASTTQLYNPIMSDWSADLINRFGLPRRIFPTIVPSGTRLGRLKPELLAELGQQDFEVIATCSHDTGAAVAAVPAEGHDWAYLSSGTWSLIGVELSGPLINDAVLAHNFTNEVGFGGTIRFLKNISGLWLLQELRRGWVAEGLEVDYAEINRIAEEAAPLRSLINPNDARFLNPRADMAAEISQWCKATGQPAPESPGQFARCVLESLALLYAEYLDLIETLTSKKITTLHVVGGGSQSRLLNQFCANATGRVVLAGPVEATAIGNLLLQSVALGDLQSLEDLRRVVRDSCTVERYEPQNPTEWQQASGVFAGLLSAATAADARLDDVPKHHGSPSKAAGPQVQPAPS